MSHDQKLEVARLLVAFIATAVAAYAVGYDRGKEAMKPYVDSYQRVHHLLHALWTMGSSTEVRAQKIGHWLHHALTGGK